MEHNCLKCSKNLERAHVEVHKAHILFDDIDKTQPIDLMVNFDSSWDNRGFISEYWVQCCIGMTTGLITDYKVLSKYCRLCDIMRQKLKDQPAKFEVWSKSKLKLNKRKPKLSLV